MEIIFIVFSLSWYLKKPESRLKRNTTPLCILSGLVTRQGTPGSINIALLLIIHYSFTRVLVYLFTHLLVYSLTCLLIYLFTYYSFLFVWKHIFHSAYQFTDLFYSLLFTLHMEIIFIEFSAYQFTGTPLYHTVLPLPIRRRANIFGKNWLSGIAILGWPHISRGGW